MASGVEFKPLGLGLSVLSLRNFRVSRDGSLHLLSSNYARMQILRSLRSAGASGTSGGASGGPGGADGGVSGGATGGAPGGAPGAGVGGSGGGGLQNGHETLVMAYIRDHPSTVPKSIPSCFFT